MNGNNVRARRKKLKGQSTRPDPAIGLAIAPGLRPSLEFVATGLLLPSKPIRNSGPCHRRYVLANCSGVRSDRRA